MIATRELDGLEFLWEAGLGERFEVYRGRQGWQRVETCSQSVFPTVPGGIF